MEKFLRKMEIRWKKAFEKQVFDWRVSEHTSSSGKDVAAVEIVKKNFNSIVAENCMKSSVIHPKENKYNFAQADEFVSLVRAIKWLSLVTAWFGIHNWLLGFA